MGFHLLQPFLVGYGIMFGLEAFVYLSCKQCAKLKPQLDATVEINGV